MKGRVLCIALGLILTSLLLFSSCAGEDVLECDHCHKLTQTSEKLIDGIDMQVCEDCYERYLQGAWGMN